MYKGAAGHAGLLLGLPPMRSLRAAGAPQQAAHMQSSLLVPTYLDRFQIK